ncbi:hypothetical protein MTBUT4_300025 [Magnetospirillum sp. UT-4]|nr:hypothetical protein MTBUT4_300025 [Magnetospirillum sp. UT-4]
MLVGSGSSFTSMLVEVFMLRPQARCRGSLFVRDQCCHGPQHLCLLPLRCTAIIDPQKCVQVATCLGEGDAGGNYSERDIYHHALARGHGQPSLIEASSAWRRVPPNDLAYERSRGF